MILEFFVLFIATAINAQKVKLKDVDVLTLYQNKLTNGRRSSPIQQLQCRGGTAGCSAFIPDVVQCYNRGSDGLDIQWECKTEMPVEYKFGKIQVSCEGYDYPDDPYILAGSCGLEYTIDRTSVNQKKSSYSGSNNGYSSNGWNDGKPYKDDSDFNFGTLICIMIVMFILYKAFFKPDENPNGGQPPTNPDFIPPAGTTPPPSYDSTQPPPYNSGRQRSGSNNGGWNWGSFGTGFGAGSFFNQTTQQRNNGYTRHRNRSRSPPSRSPSRSSGSAGTRTASGFGGTTRR